ncbi:MAG: hypothetical protein AB1457_04480 [Chloroflexota bacterium]|nr:MAG: hypothetical protein KatS3mg047_1270 [Bellilinea sp.]
MKKNRLANLLSGLFVMLLLNSCQMRTISESLKEKSTVPLHNVPTLTVTVSDHADLTPVTPPADSSETDCAYMWASQFLPEESRKMEELLNQADIDHVRVVAEAFGENCVTANGQIVRFIALQTDIRLFVNVQSLSNSAELGELAFNILQTLLDIPISSLPGIQAGYIGIQFYSNQQEVKNLWFKRDLAEHLLNSGIRDEDFLDALQKN